MKFDFAAGNAKLQKVKELHKIKSNTLKDNGVDVMISNTKAIACIRRY